MDTYCAQCICRQPRQWTQHGGLRQSYLCYPPPLRDEDDSDYFEPAPYWRNLDAGSDTQPCPSFIHSDCYPSPTPATNQAAHADTHLSGHPCCVASGPPGHAECERSQSRGTDQRPSAAKPQQASYMKPTASSLAKSADFQSKGAVRIPGHREQHSPIRIPFEECPSVAHRCASEPDQCGADQPGGTDQNLKNRHFQVPCTSEIQQLTMGGAAGNDSVSHVVKALVDVTQLQRDLEHLGSKHRNLQSLSQVCRLPMGGALQHAVTRLHSFVLELLLPATMMSCMHLMRR